MKRYLQTGAAWLFIFGLLALPFACATLLPVPTEESASWASQQWPGTTLADLQSGRSSYEATCASCHDLHLPSEFTPEKWERIMVKMQVKARINDGQKNLILRYLLTASTQEAERK